MNGYQGQLYAKDQQNQKFSQNEDIFQLIQNDSVYTVKYLKKISIFAPEMTQIEINGEAIYIGSTGMYEIDDVEITSFKFLNDSSNQVIIDYIIEKE